MSTYLVLFVIFYCTAIACATNINPLSDEYINAINNKQNLWKAGRNFHPDTPLSELKALLGVVKRPTAGIKTIYHAKDTDIPDSFDSREVWSQCESIKRIYDQANCGSCWAVSTASAMTDRLCIHSNASIKVTVSARNLMSCCVDCGDGCNGGWPISSWTYWKETGIVTGGSCCGTEGCQSYPFPECEHHGTKGVRPPCGNNRETPKCVDTCDEGSNLSYKDSLTFGTDSYILMGIEEQIQLEILKYGPVIADFTVYSDFFSYKTGIYSHTSDDDLGRHAIRVIGWGVENGVKYWLISNSWNTDWGDNGTVKIIRGQNECGIEGEVSAGLPKV